MIKNRNIILRDELKIAIYLVGYNNIGESIVFIVKSDNTPVYSGVIDSYEQFEINKSMEILRENNIKHIDFLCWTHPDEDHSIGIDSLIENFVNEQTKIFLPAHINGEEYEYNERIKNTFNMINDNLKSRKKSKFIVRDVSDNMILEKFDFDRGVKGREEFKIMSVAPNSMILRTNEFNKAFKKNDYSIALIITLGTFTTLLLGDIENRTIESFEYYYMPKVIDYIKIPHHASKTSDKILEFLDKNNKSPIATTSTYKKGKIDLPNLQIINSYRDYVKNIYCVGDSSKSNSMIKSGIIMVECNILKREITTKLYGNAYEIS